MLVNSAGAARRYAPAELDASAWHAAMDAKFFSYIHPTDVVVKRMAARGRGAIVNIIGMGGKVASAVHLPGGAANAALMLATVGLAAAYAGNGVRVNAINPGGTLTDRVQEGLEAEARMTGKSIDALARARGGTHSDGPHGHAGGGRAGRPVPRVRSRKLRHRRDRADGRREPSDSLAMAYRDLRDFIARLEGPRRAEARRVEVDPRLEMTEICDRVLKAGGPALLFEKPKGTSIPVLGAICSARRERVALGMGAEVGGRRCARSASCSRT